MLACIGIAAASMAAGQTGSRNPDDSPRKEIIVTGERAKRALKDTASSVSVISEQEIDAQAANRMDQLLASIPNVQLGNGSEGPAIRGDDTTGVLQGLDAFLGGARPRATMEVDGRAVGFQEYVFGTAPLWDVRQVEVFRSPLTVTHGRNSIAGGIVITTNDPTYNWEGGARLIAGNFETAEASALVSGPLIDDQLAFRLTGDIRHQRTTSKLSDQQRGADPNNDDYSILRLKLLGEPRALPGLKVVGTFTHSYSKMPQIVDAKEPFHPREDPEFNLGVFGVRVNSATVHAVQDWGEGEVEAVVSLGRSRTIRFAPPQVGEAQIRLHDLSGELWGNWRVVGTLTLRGGVHSIGSDLHQYIDLRQFIASEGRFRDRQKSFGAFGEAEVDLTPRLKVSAGGRYQQDRQRRVGGLTGLFNSPIDLDARFSAFLPKASATYAVTPQINAGVLVERAYNPGGATLALDTGETDRFGPEYLWDYEAFLKGTVPALRMSIAANIFYNEKKDAQRLVIVPFTTPGGGHDFFARFNNVPKAHAYGAEFELSWRASEKVNLRGGIGLLRTRVDRAAPGDDIGKEFERGPHLTGAAGADWRPSKRLRLSAQFRYRSGFASDNFDAPELRVASAATVDARVAYDVGPVTAFGYVHNVLDSLHIVYRYDANFAELEDPRVVGVGAETRF